MLLILLFLIIIIINIIVSISLFIVILDNSLFIVVACTSFCNTLFLVVVVTLFLHYFSQVALYYHLKCNSLIHQFNIFKFGNLIQFISQFTTNLFLKMDFDFFRSKFNDYIHFYTDLICQFPTNKPKKKYLIVAEKQTSTDSCCFLFITFLLSHSHQSTSEAALFFKYFFANLTNFSYWQFFVTFQQIFTEANRQLKISSNL